MLSCNPLQGHLARLNSFQRRAEAVPPSLCSVVFVNDDQAEVERAALHRVLVTTAATSGALHRLNLRPGLWQLSTHQM